MSDLSLKIPFKYAFHYYINLNNYKYQAYVYKINTKFFVVSSRAR